MPRLDFDDLDEVRAENLESAASAKIVTWAGVPADLSGAWAADERRESGRRRLTFLRLAANGFPAILAASDRQLAKDVDLKVVLSPALLRAEFVTFFLEVSPELRLQYPHKDVGVVFRWPSVGAHMLIRTGKPRPEPCFSAMVAGVRFFVEPLRQYVERVSQEKEWWQ